MNSLNIGITLFLLLYITLPLYSQKDNGEDTCYTSIKRKRAVKMNWVLKVVCKGTEYTNGNYKSGDVYGIFGDDCDCVYEGPVVYGKPHTNPNIIGKKKGKYSWYNGLTRYEGELNNGVPHGQGVYTNNVGDTLYIGQFKDGNFNGIGTLKTNDGIYSGRFESGFQVDSNAEFIWTQGIYRGTNYRGGFNNSYIQGFGVLNISKSTLSVVKENRLQFPKCVKLNELDNNECNILLKYNKCKEGSTFIGEWENCKPSGFIVYYNEQNKLLEIGYVANDTLTSYRDSSIVFFNTLRSKYPDFVNTINESEIIVNNIIKSDTISSIHDLNGEIYLNNLLEIRSIVNANTTHNAFDINNIESYPLIIDIATLDSSLIIENDSLRWENTVWLNYPAMLFEVKDSEASKRIINALEKALKDFDANYRRRHNNKGAFNDSTKVRIEITGTSDSTSFDCIKLKKYLQAYLDSTTYFDKTKDTISKIIINSNNCITKNEDLAFLRTLMVRFQICDSIEVLSNVIKNNNCYFKHIVNVIPDKGQKYRTISISVGVYTQLEVPKEVTIFPHKEEIKWIIPDIKNSPTVILKGTKNSFQLELTSNNPSLYITQIKITGFEKISNIKLSSWSNGKYDITGEFIVKKGTTYTPKVKIKNVLLNSNNVNFVYPK